MDGLGVVDDRLRTMPYAVPVHGALKPKLTYLSDAAPTWYFELLLPGACAVSL